MSNWNKVVAGGNVVVSPGDVLELYTQSSSLPVPLPTVQAQSGIRGPVVYAIQLIQGYDTFCRLVSASAASASGPQLDEIYSQLQTNTIAIAGKAAATRQIIAEGIATGGGDLRTDVVITVAKATQELAEIGEDDESVLTPLTGRQALLAYLNSIPGFDPTYLEAAHADRVAADAAAAATAADRAAVAASAAQVAADAADAEAAAATFTNMQSSMFTMATAVTAMANRFLILSNP